MPAQHAAKAAAAFIAINGIAASLPEVIEETATVTFVEVLAGPDAANGGLTHSGIVPTNIGCRAH
jgi:hypothetical protein